MQIIYKQGELPEQDAVIALYEANGWSAAKKPETLMNALQGSHFLASAFRGAALVGLANAISDGHMVVYYPHLLVHPDHQGAGIGQQLMQRMMARYRGFHQHSLLSVAEAVGFYERVGFERAGTAVAMWIYQGDDTRDD